MSDDARKFLREIYGGKDDAHYICIWRIPEKQSRWFRVVDDAIAFIEGDPRHDTYCGVALSTEDLGPVRRVKNDNAGALMAIGTDHDIWSAAHDKKPLPKNLDEAYSIVPNVMQPTFVVATGNGLQCWWAFREPWVFDGQNERDEAHRLLLRWNSLLASKSKERGWEFDRLADLARVLRVPGTWNLKDAAKPKPARIMRESGRHYDPADFREFLDLCGVADPVLAEAASKEWAAQFAGKNVVVNLNAEVPDQTLKLWMEVDPRFKATWQRTRTDLTDTSGSGYDLALANFGLDAGLNEQQIVDLIVHSRRFHKDAPRTRADYFQRTIGKAVKTADAAPKAPRIDDLLPSSGAGAGVATSPDSAPTPVPVDAEPEPVTVTEESAPEPVPPVMSEPPGAVPPPAAPPVGDDTPPALSPEEKRAEARRRLTEGFKNVIQVQRVVKIAGKEPSYLLYTNLGKVEFADIRTLMDQRRFREVIAAMTEILIPKYKTAEWEKTFQCILLAVEIEEGGEELSMEGAARMYIGQYLAAQQFMVASDLEERNARSRSELCHLPTIQAGQISISSLDLTNWLNTKYRIGMTPRTLATWLTALGSVCVRLKRGPLRDQSRWMLPTDIFPATDYRSKAPQYDWNEEAE